MYKNRLKILRAFFITTFPYAKKFVTICTQSQMKLSGPSDSSQNIFQGTFQKLQRPQKTFTHVSGLVGYFQSVDLSRFEIESVMSRSQTGWQWLSFPGTYFYFTHPNLSSHLYNMLKGGQKLRVTMPKGFNTKCGAFLKCLIQWGGRIQYSECSPEAMNGCKCNV